MTTWALVLFLAPSALTTIPGFKSEAACIAAVPVYFDDDQGGFFSRGRGWWCVKVEGP